MKNALIAPMQKVYFENQEIGERIAQVETQTFEVALPLYWMLCEDDVVADMYYLANDGSIQLNPNNFQPDEVTDAP